MGMAKKVLIIEDYPATSKMIAEVLEMEGMTALIEADGRDGLLRAGKEKPDLILLDIMLPAMSGLEICAALKNDPETKNIPVIMISVKASDEDVKIGLAKGANGYVAKPFDLFKLLEIVKKQLARAK
jgi:DNA-binding response OmpR family regulator